jgi:hypothetical protein
MELRRELVVRRAVLKSPGRDSMLRVSQLLGWFVVAAATVGAPAAHGALDGDDDDLVDDATMGTMPVERAFVIRNLDANIDAWLFGNQRGSDNGRQKVDLALKAKVEEVARAVNLTEAQKQKLLLAGERDIRRFVDRVDDIKVRYQTADFRGGGWNRIFQEVQPLRNELHRGLFGNDSFFAKTLTKTLTAVQSEHYEAVVRERRMFQHRARVEMTVMRLGTYLGLREEQRKQLSRLLLEKTPPLPALTQPDHDHFVELVLMSRLPESDLKPIFEAVQWRELQRLFRRVPQLLPMLRQEGVMLDEIRPPQLNAPATEKREGS